MTTTRSPRIRLKVSSAGYEHAADFLGYLMGRERSRLGVDPGSTCTEVIDGRTFIAHRLRCGGIDVREVGA